MSQTIADQGPSAGNLTTIHLDGSDYRVLEDTMSSIGMPALSPDGQTIAYDRGGEARLYSWGSDKTSEAINLVDYGADQMLKMANPAWSPTGKYLAWMAVTEASSSNPQAGLVLLDMQAMSLRWVHTIQTLGRGGWFPAPI